MNVIVILTIQQIIFSASAIEDFSDAVLRYPYKVNNAGRYKRDCEHNIYENTTSVKFIAHGRKELDSSKTSQPEVLTLPIVESHTSMVTVNQHMYNERNVLIHVAYIHNPVKTVSVYEPLHDGTCNSNNLTRATVQASSEYRHCLLASNAGLFNTKTGGCYGNIVSDGRLVQDSEGIENAHFGITKDGHLFFGYLSEIDVIKENFVQLVGGVIWVLKDGEPYIDESVASECRDTEETGTLQMFASVISARTLVGHDDKGRVMILQIDGKTGSFGANLYEAASILKDLGAINAINLDGGGSATYVINNTVVNHPSDKCGNFNCAREVSTILCVHEPFCKSPDCGGHGTCDLGVCHCHGYWKGINCETLQCPGSCSGHGECTEEGCVCFPGYHGDNCSTPCADGWYGDMCLQWCQCENNATCNSVTGSCKCLPGYMGPLCQYRCKLGFYGDQCSEICECKDTCLCDPETGACNYTFANEDYLHAGSCFQKKLQEKRDIEVDMLEQYKGAIFTVIIATIIAFLSIVLNFILICKYCVKCCPRRRTKQYKSSRPSSNGLGKTYELQGKKFSGFMSSSNDDELESSIVEKQSLLPS